MIKSVGIDLAGTGEHKVHCLDEGAQLCDGFSFQTTPEGLAKLEERIFSDGSNPVIVFEPTGLSWLIVAIYFKARHPDCHLDTYACDKGMIERLASLLLRAGMCQQASETEAKFHFLGK